MEKSANCCKGIGTADYNRIYFQNGERFNSEYNTKGKMFSRSSEKAFGTPRT
jgi:hypothetical protein